MKQTPNQFFKRQTAKKAFILCRQKHAQKQKQQKTHTIANMTTTSSPRPVNLLLIFMTVYGEEAP